MNRWLFNFSFLLALAAAIHATTAAAPEDRLSAKEALQVLNDFIGTWNGSGAPDNPRPDSRESWRESLSWSWRFKAEDAWLVLTVKNGKYLQSGELCYLSDKQRYQFTAVDKGAKKLVYEGEVKNGYLTLERVDPASKETQRLIMNSAGDGVTFVYRYAHKPQDRTLYTKDYQVAFTKEGETLAAKENKIECPVSGGLGTMAVNYNGITYYVCCSGCRDAFKEDPEKYIKEYEARKRKK